MKKLNKSELKSRIEEVARYDLDNQKVFGSAYCVMQDGETVYKGCFGTTTPDGGDPVTDRTLFRLASMTKPITAVAVLILVERGLLSLSDAVADFFPEFANLPIIELTEPDHPIARGTAKTPITVQQLLSHTSGFGCNALKDKKITPADMQTIDDHLAFYCREGLDFEPGSNQYYSGTGAFDLLTKVIEHVTGTDYETFLRREIFEPCGMVDTTFLPSDEQWARLIAMHQQVDGRNAQFNMPPNCVFVRYPCTHFLGGAGLVSTLHDYCRFATMLLNGGRIGDKRILAEDTLRLMYTTLVSEDIMPGPVTWGLAVRVIVSDKYRRLPKGCYGWSGAYGTHFWIDPANRITAVFMKNTLFDGGAGSESGQLFEKAVTASLEE